MCIKKKSFIKKGIKVKNNFEYSSNTNTKWMTSKEIKTWLKKYIKSEDYTQF